MGDWSFWKSVRGLVEAPQTLLEVEGDVPFMNHQKLPFRIKYSGNLKLD